MSTHDPIGRPTSLTVGLSFLFGIAIGMALVLPALPREVSTLARSDPGPIGSVLLLAVLAVALVTVGLFGLYQLFWFLDR